MAFWGSFFLFTIALIAFFGTKPLFAEEHKNQTDIENTGRSRSTKEPNKSLHTLKEVAEGSLAVHESLTYKLDSQDRSAEKVTSGSATDDLHRNAAFDGIPQIIPIKEVILDNKMQGNQENVTSKTKLADQIISPESHWSHDHISGRGGAHTYSQPPEVTAMLAGIFVAFAVIGYFGLVCWRRTLERKYGNREMLVDEEEFSSDD